MTEERTAVLWGLEELVVYSGNLTLCSCIHVLYFRTLIVPASGIEGTVTVDVKAIDVAGNEDQYKQVSWTRDVTPPVTVANITSTTFPVVSLDAVAIKTSYLTLRVGASEAVSKYRVVVYSPTLRCVAVSRMWGTHGVVEFPFSVWISRPRDTNTHVGVSM